MNRDIELHDSVIEDVIREGEDLLVTFSHAVVHETLGTPGVDSGICVSQVATLRIRDGILTLATQPWPVSIIDGQLRLGDQLLDNMIPTQIDYQGPTLFSGLVEDDDSVFSQLQITGTGVQIRMHGLAEYMDGFPGLKDHGLTN